MLNGRYPVGKAPFQIKGGENRAAHWAELRASFLAEMEELNNGKSPLLGSGQRPGIYGQAEGNGHLVCERMPGWGGSLWKSRWHLRAALQ